MYVETKHISAEEIWAKTLKTIGLVELSSFRVKHAVVNRESIHLVTAKGFNCGHHSALKATVVIDHAT